jgi:hypothetical protein
MTEYPATPVSVASVIITIFYLLIWFFVCCFCRLSPIKLYSFLYDTAKIWERSSFCRGFFYLPDSHACVGVVSLWVCGCALCLSGWNPFLVGYTVKSRASRVCQFQVFPSGNEFLENKKVKSLHNFLSPTGLIWYQYGFIKPPLIFIFSKIPISLSITHIDLFWDKTIFVPYLVTFLAPNNSFWHGKI